MTVAPPPLLEVRDLHVHFPVEARRQVLRAVDGVTFAVARGETLGLVGESGSGKTTTGLATLRLVEPTSGHVTFDGVDVRGLGERRLRRLRRRMGMVFQDPAASLDPRMTAHAAIAEPLRIHRLAGSAAALHASTDELLERVGLNSSAGTRYPHEFSGGQLQRVGIARALASDPDFLVFDEPLASLDVSVQAQILNLLSDLKAEIGFASLFISHDLAAVQHVSDRIAVMYLGEIVELGERDALFDRLLHPYTEALVSAVPHRGDQAARERIVLRGEIPSPLNPPSGCRFRTRCPHAHDACQVKPALKEVVAGHWAACHLALDRLPGVPDVVRQRHQEGVP